MFQKPIRSWFLPAILLPLLAAGCGGTGDTTNGLFGGTGTSTFGGTPSPNASVPGVTPGTAVGGLQPNSAPLASQAAGTAPTPEETQAAVISKGSLAPLSGTYAGTWTAIPTPPPTSAETPPATTDATPVKSAPLRGGALTLKISYPAHPDKIVLGDVSGTWADPARGGTGKISGTVDKIGTPGEPNAVHVVGSIQFPHGKSTALVVELSEDTVGHIGGATATDTLSLKKSH